MAAGVAAGNTEHAAAIRDLVETVTVRRIAPGKIEVEIAGRLTALLGPEAFPHGRKGVAGLMVAGVGFEPTTFRL